jgi:hypothetical protein
VPALDDPQTRAALAAHRAGALRWLGGGVVAVVFGVLLAAAAVRIAQDGGERLPFAGLMVIALFLGGLAAAAAGIGGLVRTHRWSAALAREPWRLGRLRVAGPAVLQVEPVGFDEFSGEPVRLQLSSTAVWRTRLVQRLADADVYYAPVSDREWVLTADGVGTVFGARTRPTGAGRGG